METKTAEEVKRFVDDTVETLSERITEIIAEHGYHTVGNNELDVIYDETYNYIYNHIQKMSDEETMKYMFSPRMEYYIGLSLSKFTPDISPEEITYAYLIREGLYERIVEELERLDIVESIVEHTVR